MTYTPTQRQLEGKAWLEAAFQEATIFVPCSCGAVVEHRQLPKHIATYPDREHEHMDFDTELRHDGAESEAADQAYIDHQKGRKAELLEYPADVLVDVLDRVEDWGQSHRMYAEALERALLSLVDDGHVPEHVVNEHVTAQDVTVKDVIQGIRDMKKVDAHLSGEG